MQPEDLELLVTREMPFGKHKGRIIADLPGNYLNWFAREGFPPGEIGRLLALMQEIDHNGLKDIQAKLGSADFWRLRLGIGHPRTLNLAQQVVDFVLHPPRKEELPAIEQAVERSLQAWPLIAAGNYPAAQQQLHKPVQEEGKGKS